LPVETKIWEKIKTDEEYEAQNFQQVYFKSELPYIPTSVELNLFSRQIILGALFGKVLTFKEHQHEKVNNEYSITTDSDVTLLDTSLKNWFRSLPESVSNIENNDTDVKTIWLNSFLLVKYYTILLLLHQPVIRKNTKTEIEAALNLRNHWFSSHSYDTCMLSVESISKILEKLLNTNYITIISPFFIFCVFQSCIVILVNILNTRINSLKPDKKYERFLAIHLSLLFSIRDQWRIARIYLERFFEICKFFDYDYEYACIANGIDPSPISLSYSQLTFNDTVTDNVIASSRWLDFLTILNSIQNYFNSNNKFSYFNNNDIVEPSSLNIINNPRDINSMKDENSNVIIKQENSDSPPNDFFYNPAVPSNYQQQTQRSIIIPKQQTTLYDNSLKATPTQTDSGQSNTNSSILSLQGSTIKSIDIPSLPQYSSSTQSKQLLNNNVPLNTNENINQSSSSIPMYTSLPIHEIASASTNLYPQVSNTIISNNESFQRNNNTNLNYLYMPSDLINPTTQQQSTQSLQSGTYYNYLNNNNGITSFNHSNSK